jgi:pre-mRNA-splicing factor 18
VPSGQLAGWKRAVKCAPESHDDSRRFALTSQHDVGLIAQIFESRDASREILLRLVEPCERIVAAPCHSSARAEGGDPSLTRARLVGAMDLLAAEIARKRKAKAELAAVGGVRKYAKKGQKEEAARRALLGAEKDADRGPGAAVAGGEVAGGEGALVVDPASANPAAGETRAAPSPDEREPEDDVSALDSAETIRRLRLLGEPATLFAEDDAARRARLRVAQASVAVEDEHAGGQQANERRAVLEALAREERARREKEAARLGDVSARGANASDAVPGAGVGPGSVALSETIVPNKTSDANGSELADAFEDAARRVAAARDAEASHPADQIVRFLKSLLEEWQREVDANVARDERWGRTESGRQSAANVRLCAQHLKPLFRKCAKRRLPADLERALFLVVKRMRARDYRAAADAYVGVAIGNAAWPIGVTMVGIHERSARTKINAQTQAHAMHDEETRKFLQSVKRLMTFAQRRFPTTPSLSLDFNSGVNGWDKESLLEATRSVGGESGEDGHEGAVDIRDIVPALALPDPNDPTAHRSAAAAGSGAAAGSTRRGGGADGWSSKASDVRTWRSVLKTAYDGLDEK